MKAITKTLLGIIIGGLACSALATVNSSTEPNLIPDTEPSHNTVPAEKIETNSNTIKEEAHKLKVDVKNELNDIKVNKQDQVPAATDTMKDASPAVKGKAHNLIKATKEAGQPITKSVKDAASKAVKKAKDIMHLDHTETITGAVDLTKVEKESLTVHGATNLKEVKIKYHLLVNGAASLVNSELNDVKINGPASVKGGKISSISVRGPLSLDNTKIDSLEVFGPLNVKHSFLNKVDVTASSVNIESGHVDNLKISSNESIELTLKDKVTVKKAEVIIHDKNAQVVVKLDEATNKIFTRGVVKANVPIEFRVES